MNSLLELTIFSAICLLLPVTVSGTTCYSCSSTSVGDNAGSDECASFNPLSPPPTKECSFEGPCTKNVVMSEGKLSSVTRGCPPLGVCVELNKDGNGMFCCDGDKCNSGERLYLASIFLMLALLRYIL